MTIIHSIILGIVEGITEFLPISSTGHLILAAKILNIPETEFLKTFEIAIQLGAIVAVLILYFRSFTNIEMLKKILVAFIPTGVIGLLLYTVTKTYLLGNSFATLIALGVGGLALIGFELAHKRKTAAPEIAEMSLVNIDGLRGAGKRATKSYSLYDAGASGAPQQSRSQYSLSSEITYGQAVLIGVCQAFAIIPGVSRSAATIIGGLFLGINRQTIVEFSFLLAVPTIAAATGLDIIKNYKLFSLENILHLGVGFIVSLIVALASITFLLQFIQKNTFIAFGVYRIVLAILYAVIIL